MAVFWRSWARRRENSSEMCCERSVWELQAGIWSLGSEEDSYETGRGESAIDIEEADGVLDRPLVERWVGRHGVWIVGELLVKLKRSLMSGL
jgi:hypothetical protein